MVQAFTALANGGKMQKLRFVDRIENVNTGNVSYLPVQSIDTPLSSQSAKQTLDYLKQAAYRPSSTSTPYHISGVDVAIKTGTAQIYDEVQQKYLLDEGNYIYSIVGYLPANDPEFLIYMTMEHTDFMALPIIFKQFSNFALTYINKNTTIKTDEASKKNDIVMATIPDAVNASVLVTKSAFEQLGFTQLYFFGTGDTVVKQMPLDNQSYATNEKMMFYTGGDITMPNMVGWNYQEVQRFALLSGIPIKTVGQGFVTKQSLPTNTRIDVTQNNEELTVTFETQQTETLTTISTTRSSTQSTSTTMTTR